jgi:hypothetical protein
MEHQLYKWYKKAPQEYVQCNLFRHCTGPGTVPHCTCQEYNENQVAKGKKLTNAGAEYIIKSAI